MRFLRNAPRLLAAVALAAVLGCTSSPTEPGSSPPVTPKPPNPPSTVTVYNVTVTANPPEISGDSSSTITVQVRRADDGSPPPDGTAVAVTTTLGGFNAVGGPRSVSLQLVNGRAQAVLFAGTEVGSATVSATYLSNSGVANVRIGQSATFFVSSVDPSIGNPAGGETVTILGGGFDGPVRVTFNGAAATVRSVSPNRIVVTTPSAAAAGVPVGAGQTATVDVAVTNNVNESGQQTDSIVRGFTYAAGGTGVQQPVILSVSPALGTNDGGTPVTIVGQGFQSPVQVKFGTGSSDAAFNGIEAQVQSVTPTRIVVITPAARGFGQNLTNQLVDILVKNLNNGFSTVGTSQFKYGTNVQITAVDQGAGPYTGGTRVGIQGNGFDDPVAVTFHFRDANIGIAQQVVSTSGTQVIVRTSPAPLPDQCPTNGIIAVDSISLVNIETGNGATANIGFNFLIPLPQIFNISPSSGGPGTVATISGTNFSENVQVVFGDVSSGSSAQVTSITPTAVGIRVPNAPQGFTFIQEPCDGNGDGIPGGQRNSPTPITVTVRNLNGTGCVSTLSNAFVLTPPNTTCSGDSSTPPVTVTQCTDGFDNDGDTFIDAADPQCTGPTDNSEGS
ncbi:MAG: IPT/TIG domain-containing protein [Thermoanaerobaculia bacterium]